MCRVRYVQSYRQVERMPFTERFPEASPEAADLLDHLLRWDPGECGLALGLPVRPVLLDARYTVEEALEHPFLEVSTRCESVCCRPHC